MAFLKSKITNQETIMPHSFPLSRRTALGRLGAAAFASAAAPLFAQGKWPEKPIRLIVPFAAGVSPDVVARIISEPLAHLCHFFDVYGPWPSANPHGYWVCSKK